MRGPDWTDRRRENAILTALAYTACEKGLSVRFTRVIDMINHVDHGPVEWHARASCKHYVHPSLLLLDELGYLPIDKRGADLMFQVVAARYESGSIVITTNRPFRDWGKIFDVDNTLATAMIDRLMHHGEAIVIQGDSYRTKDQEERITLRPSGTGAESLGSTRQHAAKDSSEEPSSPFGVPPPKLLAVRRASLRPSLWPTFCGQRPAGGRPLSALWEIRGLRPVP